MLAGITTAHVRRIDDAILMRIPGEAASVMTCIDGYAMARKGRAGAALAIAAVGSYIAGTASVIALMFLAPPLAAFALRFGPPEYFALLLLGLLVLAYMSGGSMIKALAMAAFGLLLGMVGIDQMTGYFRFAYGIVELGDGIGVVPIAVGLFGVAEILTTAGQASAPQVMKPKLRDCCRRRASGENRRCPSDVGRSRLPHRHRARSRTSSELRVVPVEAALSKRPEEFGHGAVRGRGRSRVGEQRGDLGRLRDDVALGVPSGPIPAVMLAAMMVHGVAPGPCDQPARSSSGLHASMYVATRVADPEPASSACREVLRVPYVAVPGDPRVSVLGVYA